MEVGGPGKRAGLPKLRELLRRQRRDSETLSEVPDIEYVYDDADSYFSEISELYSYTEQIEFQQNRDCFEAVFYKSDNDKWITATDDRQRDYVLHMLDRIESADHEERMKAMRGTLYLLQGMFGECETDVDVLKVTRHNVFLLCELEAFTAFVELLCMEMENGLATSSALKKPAVSLADSTDLRVTLNILYVIIETMRWEDGDDTNEMIQARQSFIHQLARPIYDDINLAVILFGMVTKFCSGSAPHFPMKKVLLLLWKVVLVSLGGLHDHHRRQNEARDKMGLPPLTEDTHEVCKNLRAASPPASAADLILAQNEPRRNVRGGRMVKGILKQSNMEDPFSESSDDDLIRETEADDEGVPGTPRPGSPVGPPPRRLPWTPKVRQKDLENFLENTRGKFVGFQVRNDDTSLAGLPPSIHEGVKVLKEHLYTSLAEVQIKREEEITKNPLSQPETDIPQTAAEILYVAMLPSLPQYMIALLKILLAGAPTSKAKTDSINILADVLPEEMPTTVLQSMKLGMDVNRHKEIIVKAISGLLLLLLKHFKLNHVYQFEFMSQHLVFANCIPLVLKFFNQNIMSYVAAKSSISVLDFPSCVVGEQPELTAESLEVGDSHQYCSRNLFSCINLLRVLNKLTKWKHSRTMMLVVFKSAPILKRALKVKHAMMQVYVLKLLKMQTKYLGRQWRKSNMKTMSAIYQKVRHRLNDDWAFGNDMDARPWDFQAEECALRACVDRFNSRRYSDNGVDEEFIPVDNNIWSVLGQKVALTDEFKMNYERWLEQEVHCASVDWEQVLKH